MEGTIIKLICGGIFHDVTQVHDSHRVADVPHQTQGLSLFNIEVHPVNSLNPSDNLLQKPSAHREVFLQPFHPEHNVMRLGIGDCGLGISLTPISVYSTA